FDADVNVCGLLNMLHSFSGRELPYFVFLSTGGAIYGEQDYFPADEKHKTEPTSVYGTAKRVSELYLQLWQRTYGLKFVALRLANVYGPRQNPYGEAGVVAIFNNKLLEGQVPVIYGSGEQTRDFVFVKDVARAVRLACDTKVQGIFNIGTGRETSVNSLYEMIIKSLGSTQKAEYQQERRGEQMRSCIDATLARNSFGWQPEFSIEEGVKLTCEWFRSGVS
ncbi:MAG: NAD-dependent epimerase/dehydratase family protein, partial [Deltaproteobacteria bacterium]|nr:NAD-dependent epimerase/dehydratase family protein [Deltaproteobacteria bacterium]